MQSLKNIFSDIQKDFSLSFIFFLITLFLLGSVFLYFEFQKLPNGETQIHFLQTNRGDAVYIKTPNGKEMIIDGGIDRKILTLLRKYRPFWDKEIDVLLITHPDSDHYYGALEVLKRFSVNKVLTTGVQKNDVKYEEFFSILHKKNTETVFLDAEKDFSLDGIFFDVLYPFSSLVFSETQNSNNSSLVFFLEYKGKKVLFTGDIEKNMEEKIVNAGIDLQAHILKVPHHGSKTSSSKSFVQAVSPEKAIIQTGVKNSFGHPHQEVLKTYSTLGIPLENTRDGDIILRWD